MLRLNFLNWFRVSGISFLIRWDLKTPMTLFPAGEEALTAHGGIWQERRPKYLHPPRNPLIRSWELHYSG